MVLNIIIIIGLLFLGGFFLNRAITIRRSINAAKQWTPVTAKIIESNIEEDNTRTATGKAEYSYIPHITYEYNVSGKIFKNGRIIFGRPYFDFLTAQGLRDRYPEGSEAEIYYDPQKPEQSVLLPKSTVGIVSWVPGIFITLVGVVVFLFSFVFYVQ